MYFVFKKKSRIYFVIPFWLVISFVILGSLGYSISGIKGELTPAEAKNAYDECLLSGLRGVTGNGIKEVKRICRDKYLYSRDLSMDVVSNVTGNGHVRNDGYFYATLETKMPGWEVSSVSVKFHSKSTGAELGSSTLTVTYPVKPITNLSIPELEPEHDYVLTPSENELFISQTKAPTEDFSWTIVGASGHPSGFKR